ncbi:uncharacterized protein ACNLHF_023858 [Anomaloglossus baeobatrachus]
MVGYGMQKLPKKGTKLFKMGPQRAYRSRILKRALKLLIRSKRSLAARKRREAAHRSISTQNPQMLIHAQSPSRNQDNPGGVNPTVSPNAQSREPLETHAERAHNAAPVGNVDNDNVVNADQAVFLQHFFHQQRDVRNFNARLHIDHFRFVNLDRIQSFVEAINVVHDTIQSLLDRIIRDIDPGDFVQLRLEGGATLDPIFTTKQSRDDFSSVSFLNSVARTLQSNAECLASNSLKLVVTIIKNRRGGAKRRLKSIASSQIIKQKKRWLYDFNNYNTNLCFSASVCALMDDTDVGDSVILSRAKAIHASLGIPEEQLISFSEIVDFEKLLGVNIKVLYYSQGDWRYFQSGKTSGTKNIFILHHDNHYYGIKNMKGFIGEDYFCERCNSVFHHKFNHSCQYFCKACQRESCVESSDEQYPPRCPICRVFCRSSECLDHHTHLATDNPTFCRLKTFCDKCHHFVFKDSESEHKCKGMCCPVCRIRLNEFDDHLCYMRRYVPKEETEQYIFYDFECMQETGTHIPNYIYATTLHGRPSWEFEGKSCTHDFVLFFTSGKFSGHTFIAHNAGRYDAYFIVKELISEKLCVKLISRGGRLLCVTLPDLDIRFIDSLNFIPMKLSKLPQAMGFSGSKGHFPHFFNTEENQNYVGPLPAVKYYGVEYMSPSEKGEFMEWYETEVNTTFDFKSELKAYCKQDVEILRRSCELYRERVMEMTQKNIQIYCKQEKKKIEVTRCIDPFQLVTLASVCMAMYRFKFLPKNTIAILPGDNYHKTKKRFSSPAIQWLMYVAHTENITIQHALRGGEKQVGKYFLDGYAYVNNSHIAFEFQGCFYHGCPVCYNENDSNKVTNTSYGQLYYAFLAKKRYLQYCGYTVRVLWEHDWKEMVEKDSNLQTFLDQMEFPKPLDPRDALYGGRTNAIKLYHQRESGEMLHYYDFTSLYPFVNKTKTYPVGHPHIIYENFGFIKNYFGLVKVKVYPPRDLFFPVLPVKLNKKLMFPLCYTCAVNSQTEDCTHSDEDRSLTGTWCTIEVEMAIEKGYRIAHIYEIWDFTNTSDTLFAPYIKLHLRDKQEASGYPSWCTDDNKKQQYIDTFLEKEGVQLRSENIGMNSAKRQISKLFLNSLWGKFAQRSNLSCTSIISDAEALFHHVFLPYYDISMLHFIDDETTTIDWKYTEGHHTVNKNTNIFIACFTTAYARLELYSVLDKLQERCLYHDTDSVIFVQKDGEWSPPLGDYLGELTSEIPDDTYITEFVSAGPKTYGYKLNTGKTVLKVKGITLNVGNNQSINFNSLKDLVLDYPRNSDSETQKRIIVEQPGIVKNKKYWDIETRPLRKTQRCVYTKRRLFDDFTTVPFGY